MKIKKFGIYLADLKPSFGTEPGKIRPVVVVQTNLLNETHPSTIICPITSQLTAGAKLLRLHLKLKSNGLDKPSDILIDQIRAIDNRRFQAQIGSLTNFQSKRFLENLKLLILE